MRYSPTRTRHRFPAPAVFVHPTGLGSSARAAVLATIRDCIALGSLSSALSALTLIVTRYAMLRLPSDGVPFPMESTALWPGVGLRPRHRRPAGPAQPVDGLGLEYD